MNQNPYTPDLPYELWGLIFDYSSQIPRNIKNRLLDLVSDHFPETKSDEASVKHPEIDILQAIFKNGGVVAGGAALFCMDDLIPIESVGDIDIFFTADNAEGLRKTLYEFIEIFSRIGVNVAYAYNNSIIALYPGGIRDSFLPDDKSKPISYQFILSRNLTPGGIINNFDLDYIQVAIDNKRVYRTLYQKTAQETHIVTRVHPQFRKRRLIKIYLKGYRLPEDIKILKDVFVGWAPKDISHIPKGVKAQRIFISKSGTEVTMSWDPEVCIKTEIGGRVSLTLKWGRGVPSADELERKGFEITLNPDEIPLDLLTGFTWERYNGHEIYQSDLGEKWERENEGELKVSADTELIDIHTFKGL